MNTYTYTFKVKMSCYGCVGAVIKALSNSSVKSVDINFDEQLVYVVTKKPSNDILNIINSTGKKVTLVN